VPQLDRFPIVQTLLGGPTNKLFEQGGVSALSMLRLPAFMAQVLQEIFDQSFHSYEKPAFAEWQRRVRRSTRQLFRGRGGGPCGFRGRDAQRNHLRLHAHLGAKEIDDGTNDKGENRCNRNIREGLRFPCMKVRQNANYEPKSPRDPSGGIETCPRSDPSFAREEVVDDHRTNYRAE